MKHLLSKLNRDSITAAFVMTIVFAAFILGALGNDFAKEVFQSTWVTIPTYLGISNWRKNG